MGTPAVLEDLQRRGFQLKAAGDRLRVIPASKLTDEIRDAIRKHKAELLEALAPRQAETDLEQALAEACTKHGPDAAEIKAELVKTGDWADMTPDRLRVYIEAVARSRLPGTRAELRALIHQWADVGGVADAQHQELLEAADGLAPALIGENVQWFCRRLEDYAGSQVLPSHG